ncbi:hypothetical protein BH11PSE10_BH11PSE10_00830 [soil metagenome]
MRIARNRLARFAAAVLMMVTGLPALAVSAMVAGNANPNLAGRDPGYGCCSGDVAPDQSPTLVSGLSLDAGLLLNFSVTGEVSYGGGAGSGNNPDGSYYGGVPYNYGDGITAPANLNRVDALLGVFLGAGSPTGSTGPAAIDFAGGVNFTALSPQIGQVFFIGNGSTGDTSAGDFGGTLQQFVVPAGATRLYLGTADGYGWANNNGSFTVEINAPVPEPAGWVLMALGLLSLLVRRRAGCRG